MAKKPVRQRFTVGDITFVAAALFLLGFIVAYSSVSPVIQKENIYISEPIPANEKSILIVAVNNESEGVYGYIKTSVRPGSGRVLVNVDSVLSNPDTQKSAQIATAVAGNYTNLDLSYYDVIYDLKINATYVEGPSAGAAMTVSTIAALKNMTINQSIAISGLINPDGAIAPAGALYQKGIAAQKSGATVFLVAPNSSVVYENSANQDCSMTGIYKYCKVDYEMKSVSLGKLLNMTVIEVGRIDDAVDYMLYGKAPIPSLSQDEGTNRSWNKNIQYMQKC